MNLLCFENSRAVNEDHECSEIVEHRACESADNAKRGKSYHQSADADRERKVLINDASRLSCKLYCKRNVHKVVVHKRDVSGFYSEIRAHSTHCDTNVSLFECKRVVDSVANRKNVICFLELLERRELILGEKLCLKGIYAYLSANSLSGFSSVRTLLEELPLLYVTIRPFYSE